MSRKINNYIIFIFSYQKNFISTYTLYKKIILVDIHHLNHIQILNQNQIHLKYSSCF